MMVMVVHDARSRGEWLMVVVLSIIGVALVALAPRKQSAEGALPISMTSLRDSLGPTNRQAPCEKSGREILREKSWPTFDL
jgi:hypothetical protein